MMNRLEIFNLLKVQPSGLLVKNVQIGLWGKSLTLEFLYGVEEYRPFRLQLKDCRDIHWEITGDPDERDKYADVLGIFLGEEHYKKPINIATHVFELSISYDEMIVEKSW